MAEKRKILVVEDNKDMQTIYEDMLSEKYYVEIVGNTADARKALEKSAIDLMVLDIILPKQTGDEFYNELAKSGKFRKLKVICVTVLNDTAKRLKAENKGIEIIQKPFKKEQLLAKMQKMFK